MMNVDPGFIRSAVLALTLWGVGQTVGAGAAAADAAGLEYFEKHIRPLLVENCYSCHSAEAEKIKGGLLLDTRDGLRSGSPVLPLRPAILNAACSSKPSGTWTKTCRCPRRRRARNSPTNKSTN